MRTMGAPFFFYARREVIIVTKTRTLLQFRSQFATMEAAEGPLDPTEALSNRRNTNNFSEQRCEYSL